MTLIAILTTLLICSIIAAIAAWTSRSNKITQLTAEKAALQERLNFLGEERDRITEEAEIRFQNMANNIFQQNSRIFKEQHEARLSEILSPLKQNIEDFKKTFAESYAKESRERFALDQHIRQLVELNTTIGREAQDLTRALRGNSKVQGDWGEMILEGILERSGLMRNREFTIQESTTDTEGRRHRADVVINYPDGRCAVIDSKVSLTNYVKYMNCDEKSEREIYGRDHVRSVRAHIAELREKKYQDYLGKNKADFVMMFIPNEGAYMSAMQLEPNIWQEAFDSRVLIVSPTHLISVMKLIEQLWMHDRQNRNAIDIATESGKMLDKFMGLLEDITKIEKGLDATRNALESATKKLSTGSGNLINRSMKLKQMGAKASKTLPPRFTPEE